MKNIWRGICVAVFVFGAVSVFEAQKRTASLGVANQSTKPSIDVSDTEPALGFVVEFVDSNVSPDGKVTTMGSTTRYVKADGEWRLEMRRNNGARPLTYSGTPDGVFEKNDSASRRYVSPSTISPSSDQRILELYRSHNYLRSHPEFVRMDQIAGLDVYVLRTAVPNDPTQWRESAYSPRTGLTTLRSVLHQSDGSEIRREAVNVEFKDIPENLNHDLKSLPITNKEE
jgi:hypothetical protein